MSRSWRPLCLRQCSLSPGASGAGRGAGAERGGAEGAKSDPNPTSHQEPEAWIPGASPGSSGRVGPHTHLFRNSGLEQALVNSSAPRNRHRKHKWPPPPFQPPAFSDPPAGGRGRGVGGGMRLHRIHVEQSQDNRSTWTFFSFCAPGSQREPVTAKPPGPAGAFVCTEIAMAWKGGGGQVYLSSSLGPSAGPPSRGTGRPEGGGWGLEFYHLPPSTL